jgi:hypothetical protein
LFGPELAAEAAARYLIEGQGPGGYKFRPEFYSEKVRGCTSIYLIAIYITYMYLIAIYQYMVCRHMLLLRLVITGSQGPRKDASSCVSTTAKL